MRRFLRVLAIIILCMLTLCACKDNNRPGGEPTDIPDDITITKQPQITGESGPTNGIGGDSGTGNQTALKIVEYYTVSLATDNVSTVRVVLDADTEISPALIVDLLIDSLEDEAIELSVDYVKAEDNICIISFDNSIYSISKLGTDFEYRVLDCVAQSILDNIEGCIGVVYRINGNSYSTGNITLGVDEIYMDN